MGLRDELNIVTGNVVPSATLEDQEGYAVTFAGAKTTAGILPYGVVRIGRPANEASQVVIHGECTAKVNGSGTSLAAMDPIAGGASGKFVKAVAGSTFARGVVLEAVTTDTTARVYLF
jgi:hypothetical protein